MSFRETDTTTQIKTGLATSTKIAIGVAIFAGLITAAAIILTLTKI